MPVHFRHRTGRPPHPDVLTPAEWRVLEQVRAGRTNPEIAEVLGVSVHTVKTQVSSMLSKLDLDDRKQLAEWRGEPAPISRSAVARLGLAAPLGWLRSGRGASWLARAAAVGGLAALSTVTIVALNTVARGSDAGTPSPVPPTPAASATLRAEGPSPTPTPPPAGFPVEAPPAGFAGVGLVDGLPVGASGPLVVYTQPELPAPPPEPRRSSIEVFDLGSGRRVSAFTVAARQVLFTHLAGRRVLVSFGSSVWSYALDGSDGVELYAEPDRHVERMTPSPDGRYLAIGEGGVEGGVRVLDASTGDELLFVRADDQRWDGLVGHPGPERWLDEASMLIAGWTYGHSPGGTAVLSMDGAVEVLESAPLPDGRTVEVRMEGRLWTECGLAGPVGATAMQLVGEDGQVVRTVEAAGPLLGPPEFAPDGASMLYRVHLPDDALLAELVELEAGTGCLSSAMEQAIVAAPVEWRLHDLENGDERTLPRLDALREWYGDRTVSYACGDEEMGGNSQPLASPPLRGAAGAGPPWGYSDRDCGWTADSIELRVGGTPVATGRDFQVLGFIEM